jgi:regulator of protease activity HflC (stomatin/prohibitin superfamily)
VINDLDLNVISADNAVFDLKLLVVYRIDEPERAVFRVSSVDELVTGLVMSLVRSEIGKVELDAIQKDRHTLNEAIRLALAEAGEDYGVKISRSEIIDVRLSASTENSMAAVLNAERERRATVTTAEGHKRSVELNAEAELYEKRQQAEALTVMATATANANKLIAESIGENGEAALHFQIAKLQVDALTKVAASPNTKVVMLPTDATKSFAGAAAILGERA